MHQRHQKHVPKKGINSINKAMYPKKAGGKTWHICLKKRHVPKNKESTRNIYNFMKKHMPHAYLGAFKACKTSLSLEMHQRHQKATVPKFFALIKSSKKGSKAPKPSKASVQQQQQQKRHERYQKHQCKKRHQKRQYLKIQIQSVTKLTSKRN